MGLYLFIRWLFFFALTLVAGPSDLYESLGASVIAIANVVILLFGIAYWILVDRLVTLFLPVRPLFCSIYDRFLATRTILEGPGGAEGYPGLQWNAVQDRVLAFARCPDRPQGLR